MPSPWRPTGFTACSAQPHRLLAFALLLVLSELLAAHGHEVRAIESGSGDCSGTSRANHLDRRRSPYTATTRLLRLFRLFRFGRLAGALAMLTRVVQARRAELGVTLAVVGVAVLVAAGAIYTVEHGEPDTQFSSIPRAMWWSIVTITTVGYGDMTPMTSLGKVIGGVVAFVGICALALPVGILSTGFFDELNRGKPPSSPTIRLCPHCGGAVDHDVPIDPS